MDNAEDLDIVKPIYNFLEYSNNYFMTSETLWNYYRDEVNDDVDENDDDDDDYRVNNNKTRTSKYFEYKMKSVRSHQMILID